MYTGVGINSKGDLPSACRARQGVSSRRPMSLKLDGTCTNIVKATMAGIRGVAQISNGA